MGNTASGLPWPEPTAPVKDGAASVKALADALEKRIAKSVRGGRSDLVASTGGNFKIILTDLLLSSIVVTPMIPSNAVATVIATEGAGGSGQKSAAVFQMWVNGVAMASGASCAVMWVATGTPA